MDCKIRWEVHISFADTAQRFSTHSGSPTDHHSRTGQLTFGNLPLIVFLLAAILRRPTVLAGVIQNLTEFGLVSANGLACVFFGELATSHKVANINLTGRRQLGDQRVHDRLGHRRIIALVVTTPAVAHQIDENILVESLAISQGQSAHAHDCFGVIGVDVEDGDLQALCQVRRIARRTTRSRSRRETNLVIHDDVNSSAGLVSGQLGHIEGFLNHALSDESRVTVDQQGNNGQIGIAQNILLCAHDSFEHSIGGFKVRGVSRQGHLGRNSRLS